MFIVGLPGEQLDESTYGLLVGMSPSGVCLFARNTREAGRTRILLESVRDALLFEPFLCVDQEGGLVDRLRRILEPMPSPKDVSENSGPEGVRTLARITAEALRTLGFNTNFAPVTDVITPKREPYNNGLHSRGMGSNPLEVSANTIEYISELQKGGVLGCIKHFPGIGAAEADSHDELPVVGIDENELSETDLEPYRKHFAAGDARAVMTGHAAFPHASFQTTDERGRLIPTSLNENVVTGLLRDKLGFGGVSLTDDLEMGAIIRQFGIGEACVMAVEAGHDLLLICNSLTNVEIGYRAVSDAVMNGRISEDRLNVSLERIRAARKELQPPFDYDHSRLEGLSEQIKELKNSIGG